MAKKSLDKMSANELYKLAQKREQEEQQKAQEEKQAKIEALRQERKTLIADHNKALRAIDKQLASLTGRKTKANPTSKASTGRKRGSLTAAIVEILSSQKSVATSDLRVELDQRGMASKNLNQQLAYLKRKGQIKSAGRGAYSVA